VILQELVKYYETLARDGKTALPGWCSAKVSYIIRLNSKGKIEGIIPAQKEIERGKKTIWVADVKLVPLMEGRSSTKIVPNFLCDNSKYMLGIDGEGCSEKTIKRFEAAKEKHLSILKNAKGEAGSAVKAFFEAWDPKKAKEDNWIKQTYKEVTDGGNLIFEVGGEEVQEDEEIRLIWDEYQKEKEKNSEEGEKRVCLVTGERTEIARIHPLIKGLQGAQSSGAALVSFNAPAFESYEMSQSYNAAVGTYAAFAYTTALNYLLSQRKYVFQCGDTTIVFWAENGKEEYQQVFLWSVERNEDNTEKIREVFERIREGKQVKMDKLELDPEQPFYIAGLAANAARISVQFFYQNSFGKILSNIEKHYERMKIVRPKGEEREYVGLWRMINETVNQKAKDKKPAKNLPPAVFQAVLNDTRYPQSLYSQILLRIRAEQGRVTWGRAAAIKAFQIKNYHMEEGMYMELNGKNERKEQAQILGRVFAVLEAIQETSADGKLNTTIRDRYFNAACANPATVFPILMKLKNSHMRKLGRDKEGLKIKYEKQLTDLLGKLDECPRQLNLEEQGRFILGYYHQTQKRYEKKA